MRIDSASEISATVDHTSSVFLVEPLLLSICLLRVGRPSVYKVTPYVPHSQLFHFEIFGAREERSAALWKGWPWRVVV